MPATIEFNRERAVDRATQVFWRKGYKNASLRDLLKAMGIGEGSFYNTFKSKRRLYLECLKHYNDTVSRRRLGALTGPASVKEGIRAFFQSVLHDLDNPKTPAVCLLAGSLSSDVLAERELGQVVLRDMQSFSEVFHKRMDAAKQSGELPSSFNSVLAAQVIITFLLGLFRVVRTLQSRAEVERQIEALLGGLGL